MREGRPSLGPLMTDCQLISELLLDGSVLDFIECPLTFSLTLQRKFMFHTSTSETDGPYEVLCRTVYSVFYEKESQ